MTEGSQGKADLIAERDYWRNVAAYLASCHAATAEYDGTLSGVSRARKERFASICHTAAQAMQTFRWAHHRYETPEDAEARCMAISKKLLTR